MIELMLYTLFVASTLISVYLVVKLQFAFKHFQMKQLISESTMIDDLPSVSVCIPARNETHAMTGCLERVIASTYPKLEIIVLDDSSVDDTSILIKSFAHAGVRFVEGSKLTGEWLGKNHALQELMLEASGTYVLFMDVDTLIEPDTIGQLVAYAKSEDATMVSVLPRRVDGWRGSVIFAPLRYFRELVMHSKKTPATASNAWMINRRTLRDEMHGFESLRGHIQPESEIAAKLSVQNKYRFLIGTELLGVNYEKKWSSQIETSIRLLYPTLGGNSVKNILAVIALTVAILPAIILPIALAYDLVYIQIFSLWQLCVYIAIYAEYLSKVWRHNWWLGALLWPVVVVQELVLVIISVVRYRLGTVTWKGRRISTQASIKVSE